MLVVAIILAIVVGIGFAYGLVAGQVFASNNYGDSVGEVQDFARGTWNIVESRNYNTQKKEWLNDKFFMERMTSVSNMQ